MSIAVAIVVGVAALLALAAAVVGFLWLLQFVIGNEEERLRDS